MQLNYKSGDNGHNDKHLNLKLPILMVQIYQKLQYDCFILGEEIHKSVNVVKNRLYFVTLSPIFNRSRRERRAAAVYI